MSLLQATQKGQHRRKTKPLERSNLDAYSEISLFTSKLAQYCLLSVGRRTGRCNGAALQKIGDRGAQYNVFANAARSGEVAH